MASESVFVSGSGLPKIIFGYEVLDFIGEGAGSTLYAVSDPKSRQLYALKHVVPQTEKDQRFVDQLEAEFEIGRLVNHPGLRKSIDLRANRTLLRKVTEAALVMELFDGLPLEQSLPKRLTRILDVFIQTAEALAYLHTLGYVHCDLKPNNVLLGVDGQVKVIDLGQTCKAGTIKPRIQGTPDYIAPEQVRCEEVTPRTDVYNLGATLYWALTKKNLPTLFTLKKGDNSFLVDAHMPSPSDVNPAVPKPVSDFVMECVKTNPSKRPQEMSDIVRKLDILLHVASREQSAPSGARVAVG